MKINRDKIIAAGMAVFDERGLADLNMRAVADRLGVAVSALYRHVANKDELLALMSDDLFDQAMKAATGSSWADWLNSFGHAFRTGLLAHRDAPMLCAIAQSLENAADAMESTSAPLVARGLSKATALAYLSSVVALTHGWALYEQGGPQGEFLAKMIDFDQNYDLGLNALIAGLSAQAAT